MRLIMIILIGWLLISPVTTARAQQEEPQKAPEEQAPPTVNEHFADHIQHIRRATIMSAALPGLGQIYNKKYWKVPIIYAGAGALVYFIDFNNSKYLYYKELYANVGSPGPNSFYDLDQYEGYSEEQLKDAFRKYMDSYRRYRDLNIIGLTVLYIANIVDAHVDAYFLHYDVSEKLTLNMGPSLITPQPQQFYTTLPAPALRIQLRF